LCNSYTTKHTKKPQKSQSDTLRCTELVEVSEVEMWYNERSRNDDFKLHKSKNSTSKKELTSTIHNSQFTIN